MKTARLHYLDGSVREVKADDGPPAPHRYSTTYADDGATPISKHVFQIAANQSLDLQVIEYIEVIPK